MPNFDDLIGTPYAFRDSSAGYDCYNLERALYRRRFGVDIGDPFVPDPEQAATARLLWQARQLRAGEGAWLAVRRRPFCTMLIRVAGVPVHLAHYVGGGDMIEASKTAGQVIRTSIAPLERAGKIAGYFLPPALAHLV